MVVLNVNDYIWLTKSEDADLSVPIGGIIRKVEQSHYVIEDDDGRVLEISKDYDLKLMHPSSVSGVDDMIDLGELNEGGILRNLCIRYAQNQIYTYTGSILVALNPYQILPIYNADYIKMYRKRKIGELPPHLFAIGDNAYCNMRKYGMDQCIIISGESGAGKTESTKLLSQFLAAVSGQHSWTEQQILDSNPIMEAFGNAKTVRNDNSSRFGKYIEIHFSRELGSIVSAKIDQYLLEKSRIVTQTKYERNFHAFYYMLAGMSDEMKNLLGLTKVEDYEYLIQGGVTELDGRHDSAGFTNVNSALKVLTFTKEDIDNIWKLLAVILHLGNVRLKDEQVNGVDASKVCSESDLELEWVSRLLQVSLEDLSTAMTVKISSLGIEVDVNKAVHSTNSEHRICLVEPGRNTIGILDIFGFENFSTNSFEQFCINYANEYFQQFFVQHIFKLEQEEYLTECISWRYIDYVDNQNTLNLIAIQPMNIFALLDEESRFPQGSDNSFLNKINSRHSSNIQYVQTTSQTDKRFGIQHFTGVVYYYVDGFLDKNRDTFSSNLVNLIIQSENEFLRSLFTNSGLLTIDPRKRSSTLAIQFKKSLDNLMRTLNRCQPFFVRCIKPNDIKQSNIFDRELCIRQLRYSGMMETIRIRRAGYPIRHKFHEFIDRYHPLIIKYIKDTTNRKEMNKIVESICSIVLSNKDYRLGRSKVFLKYVHDTQLEHERDCILNQSVIKLQTNWRKFNAYRNYTKVKESVIYLQAVVKGWIARKSYKQIRCAVLKIQAAYHRHYKRKTKVTENVIIQLQAVARGYLIRKEMKCRQQAAKCIQQAYRTFMLQKNLTKLKISKEDTECKRYEPIDESFLVGEVLNIVQQDEIDITHDRFLGFNEKSDYETPDHLLTTVNGSNKMFTKHTTDWRNFEYTKSEPTKFHKLEFCANDFAISYVEVSSDDNIDNDSKFIRYATTYFQAGATPYYTKQLLSKPLLIHKNEEDNKIALTIWMAILRFMEILPESETSVILNEHCANSRDYSITSQPQTRCAVCPTLQHRKSVDASRGARSVMKQTIHDKCKPNIKQNLIITRCQNSKYTARVQINAITSQKPHHIVGPKRDEKEKQASQLKCITPLANTVNYSSEDLPLIRKYNKLYLIIRHGIMRPSLHDEIYCQICKSINKNPSHRSQIHGWFLLSLCIGCFLPSKQLLKPICQFIQSAPSDFTRLCIQRLQRTLINGARNQPPSLTELRAIY
ncbi:unnamed protein product [Heterobilharzia americana]|nr:unnamed protein product [Heterobilharzia americana]